MAAAYLDHRHLADQENAAERFFMNVVLCRVLYAHALVAAPGSRWAGSASWPPSSETPASA